MIFLSFDFVRFAAAFFLLYLATTSRPEIRLLLIVAAGIWFLVSYGGAASLAVTLVLAAITFGCARSERRALITAAIVACVGALVFYKYTLFLAESIVGPLASPMLASSIKAIAPHAIPLGISFFTFEFVHYLVDTYRGSKPLKSIRDFAAFALFWPTMVAGPIKRYQQFVPALHVGLKRQGAEDTMHGLIRVAIGLVKKWGGDYLTAWIDYTEPNLSQETLGMRWAFLAAIAARILLDFSGYSDMAIGYARIMGVTVPENFNWPYLARSPIEFWQRWHMSLSTWIRDYVYIPLGGNRLGVPRRIANALAAMTICGLWHGASWNFAVWGIYHGFGLAATAGLRHVFPRAVASRAFSLLGWLITLLFVSVGWVLFFYPLPKAWNIILLLVPW